MDRQPLVGVAVALFGFGYFALRRPSEHFSWDEWTTTSTGLDNSPDLASAIRAAWTSRTILEPLRAQFGPLTITSGYRSQAVNDAVGGSSSTSQHMYGDGVDLKSSTASSEEMAAWLYSHGQDLALRQVIWYSPDQGGHLHLGRDHDGAPGRREFYYMDGDYHDWSPPNVS